MRSVHPSRPPQHPRWRATADRHRWWLIAALTATALATWTWWPTPQTPPTPRARTYSDFTACLLTSDKGVTDPDAAPVWAGLSDASLTTHAKVQYLAISGPQTVDNGQTFVATLSQTKCNLIFAAGTTPTTSVDQSAANFPNTHFYIIGTATPQPNVSIVATGNPATVRQAVSNALRAAAP